jgi:hypothetical protein
LENKILRNLTLKKTDTRIFQILVGLAIAVAFWFIAQYLWRRWTLYALVIYAPYLMGGFRFMPWKKAWAKVFSIGVFMGSFFAAIIWLCTVVFK